MPKKFYREIGKNEVNEKETPCKGSTEKFRKGIWGTEKFVICLQADREYEERQSESK